MGSHGRVALGLVAAVLAAAGEAHAQYDLDGPSHGPSGEPATRELGAGVSFLAPPIHGGANPFGVGFGGRLGFSIRELYLGVGAVDYLGGQDVDLTTHAILYGGEVGYDLRFEAGKGNQLTVRPLFGVGGVTLFYTTPTTSSSAATGSSTSTRATNVDVLSGATSISSGSSSSSSGSFSSGSSVPDTSTTTLSNVYLQPGVRVMFSSPWSLVGVKGSMLVVPGVSDGGSGSTTWITWGIEGELGVRF